MMRSERNRRSSLPVSRNLIGDRTIPAHLRSAQSVGAAVPNRARSTKGALHGTRSLWHNLSPYYMNGITIDSRWSK